MPSRLAAAQSAYLRSAAHQPVDWHAWGPEPFERARREHKPVLLDIGAVWCHWCHVMDRESYEDRVVAEALNRDWICVKVDRDERPDVDTRYQRAVQALTGQGGWPLTAFLTGDGDVFYGGTYFPPHDGHGRPGFLAVLRELHRIYQDEHDKVVTQAGQIRAHLANVPREAVPGPVGEALLDDACDGLARLFDVRYGGFGTQPKFPHPGACELLLARWVDTGEGWLRDIVDRTLLAMARGGIYDQIGGGFHRYTVDARWVVPHFEKMAYDNAELLRVYVHAAASAAPPASAAGGEERQARQQRQEEYRRVVAGTTDWIMTTLARPEGGYGASQDADVGLEDDGDYFTWTPDEVRAVVTDEEFAVLGRHYDIDAAGEMRHNPAKNVLWVKQPVTEIAAATGWTGERVTALLASGVRKLQAARGARPAPFVDTTVYTGWSAMLASALLEAGALLDRPDVERHALLSIERLFREASDPSGLVRHTLGGDAAAPLVLEDQAQLAAAALDAFELTGESAWLHRARALAARVWERFATDDGTLLDRPRDADGHGFLSQPLTPIQDAPAPSGNGVAALLAARLAEHTGEPVWRERLERLLDAVAGGLVALSLYAATLLRGVDWRLHPAMHVVLVGEAEDPASRALLRAARRAYRPRKLITRLAPGAVPTSLPPPLQAMLDGTTPRAYVCADTACAAPTADPDELAVTIATFGRSGT
jgi:uncharacterized protein YyaL (SSP411 family)